MPRGVMFGELVGGKGAREGLDGAHEGGNVGLWNEIRRMTKGRQMVSTGLVGVRFINAEMACHGELQSCRATRNGRAAIHRRHLQAIGGRGKGGERGKRGGGGGVLPERLRSGSDHRRLGARGPSNGSHKLGESRTDFWLGCVLPPVSH